MEELKLFITDEGEFFFQIEPQKNHSHLIRGIILFWDDEGDYCFMDYYLLKGMCIYEGF